MWKDRKSKNKNNNECNKIRTLIPTASLDQKQTITTAVNYLKYRGRIGAEICELVGLYILNGIKNKPNGTKVGVYRDDGLIAIDSRVNKIFEKPKRKLTSMQTK